MKDPYLDQLLSNFDIKSYLDSLDVRYKTEGKNVSFNHIEISCPFCFDSSEHMGISLDKPVFSCWICSKKGNYLQLISKLSKTSWSESIEILKKFQDFFLPEPKFNDFIFPKEIEIPKEFKRIEKVPELVYNFLLSRGFDPLEICKNKELYYSGNLGQFKFRLIVPVYQNNRLVTFIGRNLTNKSPVPYLNYPKEKSVLPIKETLYGLDECNSKKPIIIVEGILDQWKLGNNSLATFGIQWTKEQVILLKELKPKKIIILYDSEEKAQQQAYSLAKELWFSKVSIMELEDHKDPGELSISEAQQLMKKLLNG